MSGDRTTNSSLRELVEKPINWGVDLINSRKFNDIINAFNPSHKDFHLDKVSLVNKKDLHSSNSLLDQADKTIGNAAVTTFNLVKTHSENIYNKVSHNHTIESAINSKLGKDTGHVLNETGHLTKELAVGGFDFLVQSTATGIAQFNNHKDSPEIIKDKLTLFKPEEAKFGSPVDVAHKVGAIGSLFVPYTAGMKVYTWGAGVIKAVPATIKAIQYSPTVIKIAAPVTAFLASPAVQQQLDKASQTCARVGQPISNFLAQHPNITNGLDKTKQVLDISKPAQQAIAAGGVFSFLQPVKDSNNQLPERMVNSGLTMLTGAVFRTALGASGYGTGAAEALQQGAKAVALNAIKDRAIFASISIPTGWMSTQLHAFSQGRLYATPQEYANATLFATLSVAATIPRSTARLFEKTSTQKAGTNTIEKADSVAKSASDNSKSAPKEQASQTQTEVKGTEVKGTVVKAQTNEAQSEVKAPIPKAQTGESQADAASKTNAAQTDVKTSNTTAQTDIAMPVIKKAGTKIEPDENILNTFRSGDRFRNHRNVGNDGEKGSLINSPFGKAAASKIEQIKLRPRDTTTGVPALQKSQERVIRPVVEKEVAPAKTYQALIKDGELRPQHTPIAFRRPVNYKYDSKYSNANNINSHGESRSLISSFGSKAAIPVKLDYANFGKGSINISDSLRGMRAKPPESVKQIIRLKEESQANTARQINSIYKPGEQFGNPSNIPNINNQALGLRFSYLGDKAETCPMWRLTSKKGTGDNLSSRTEPMEGLYFNITNPRYSGPRLPQECQTAMPLLRATKPGEIAASPFRTSATSLLREYQDLQIGNILLNTRYFSPSNTGGTLTEKFQGKMQAPCHLAKPLDCFAKANPVSAETIAAQTRANLKADTSKVAGTWHNVDAIHRGLPGLLSKLRPTEKPNSAIKPNDPLWLGKNSKAATDKVSETKNGSEAKNTANGHESRIAFKKPGGKDSDTTHGSEGKISSPKIVNHPRVHAERLQSAISHKQKLAETVNPSVKRHRQTMTKLQASNKLYEAHENQKALSVPNTIESETIDYAPQSKISVFKPYQSHNNIPAFDSNTYLTKPGGLLNTTLADQAILNRPVTLIPGKASQGTSLAKRTQTLEIKPVDQNEFNLPSVPSAEETLGMLRLMRSKPSQDNASRTIYSEQSAELVNEIPQNFLPQRIGAGLEIRNPRYLDSTNTVKPLTETFAPKIQGEADAAATAPRTGYKMPAETNPVASFSERLQTEPEAAAAY